MSHEEVREWLRNQPGAYRPRGIYELAPEQADEALVHPHRVCLRRLALPFVLLVGLLLCVAALHLYVEKETFVPKELR